MLLYNQRKEFVGIDSDDLNSLGFSNMNELLSESNDFADLFVKKPGYIHNFKNFSWIDFILHSETGESKAIIHAKGKNYSCLLHVAGFHFMSDESGFAVLIKSIRLLKGAEDAQASKSLEASGGIQPTPVATPTPVVTMPEITPEPVDVPSINMHEDETPSLDISLEDMQLDEPYESSTSLETEPEIELPNFGDSLELNEPDLLDIPEPQEFDSGYSLPTENEFGAPVENEFDAPLDIEEDLSFDIEEPEQEEVSNIIEEAPAKEETPMLGDYVSSSDSEHLSELITSGTYVYNPQVAADELGLPVDLIEEFIGDFIDQAHEFHDDLYASVNGDDYDNIQILSHKLKGVAANLRVEDAFDVLSVVNASKDNKEIIPNLNAFYKIIAKLEGKEIEEPAAVAAPVPTPEPVVEDEAEPELELGIALKQPDDAPMLIDEDVTPMDDDLYGDLLATEPEPELEVPAPTVDSFDDEDLYDDLLAPTPEVEEVAIQEAKVEPVDLDDDDDIYGDLLGASDESISTLQEPEIADEPEVSDEPAVEVPSLNFDSQKAANELGIPVEIVNEFIQEFKEQVNSHIVDFDSAVEAEDIHGVKKTATLLKGMSDNLRLNEISEVLRTLQQSNDINHTQHEIATLQAYANQL